MSSKRCSSAYPYLKDKYCYPIRSKKIYKLEVVTHFLKKSPVSNNSFRHRGATSARRIEQMPSVTSGAKISNLVNSLWKVLGCVAASGEVGVLEGTCISSSSSSSRRCFRFGRLASIDLLAYWLHSAIYSPSLLFDWSICNHSNSTVCLPVRAATFADFLRLALQLTNYLFTLSSKRRSSPLSSSSSLFHDELTLVYEPSFLWKSLCKSLAINKLSEWSLDMWYLCIPHWNVLGALVNWPLGLPFNQGDIC